jgi:hypothetical protein
MQSMAQCLIEAIKAAEQKIGDKALEAEWGDGDQVQFNSRSRFSKTERFMNSSALAKPATFLPATFLKFLWVMSVTKVLKTRKSKFNAGELLPAFFQYHENIKY